MNKKKIAAKVQEVLQKMYPAPKVPLNHVNIYTLLIAVLLSASCQDARVNSVTKILFSLADNPADMINLGVDEIAKIIHSLGLAAKKSKAIFDLSVILLEKYGGRVPASLDSLKSLPGVGHKTASVVISQGFNQAAFPVDTHIHRCAKRWGLSCGKNVSQTEKDLKQLFDKNLWRDIHIQIIYFAREFCPAVGHKEDICPICSWLKNPKKEKLTWK